MTVNPLTALGPTESAVTNTHAVFASCALALYALTPTMYSCPLLKLGIVTPNVFAIAGPNGTVAAGE
jgi:hypothetical protein